MKTLRFILGLALFGVLAGFVPDLYAQATSKQVILTVPKDAIRSRDYQITWRNGASADTTKRLFTGAAVLADTSREVIPIYGANTISLQDTYTMAQDSARVMVYLQISNDGTNFFTYAAAGAHNAQAIIPTVATDSSGAADTPESPFTKVVNVATPPTFARFLRVIARKHNSAATDSVYLETYVHVSYNDE